jgi:hypothetical protein
MRDTIPPIFVVREGLPKAGSFRLQGIALGHAILDLDQFAGEFRIRITRARALHQRAARF